MLHFIIMYYIVTTDKYTKDGFKVNAFKTVLLMLMENLCVLPSSGLFACQWIQF